MEIWDLYDEDLNNTNITISSEDEVPSGYYHIALELWIVNNKKEVLLLKNSLDYSKRYPGSWCCVGGNLHSKETYEDAIKRIIKEKIGISVQIDNVMMSKPTKRFPYGYAYITCVIPLDIDLNNINFEDNNSTKAKYVDKLELIKMCNNGEIAYYLISRINEKVLPYIN